MDLTVGFLVNPIAGVGAQLAWKGSDDIEKAWDAVVSGAKQPAIEVAKQINFPDTFNVMTTSTTPWIGEVVYEMPTFSRRESTLEAVKSFGKVDLIVFVGGDGTARDVASVANHIPIIGIPGGVKIFSPCFVHKPIDLVPSLLRWNGDVTKVELLDLDEEMYANGMAMPRLLGEVTIPLLDTVQRGKMSFGAKEDSHLFEMIAERIRENNWFTGCIVVGPGSTMLNIMKHLDVPKTLLGVDIYVDGSLEVKDATTQQLLEYQIDEIWVTPIGNQGHILGRGNRQLSSEVLGALTLEKIRIFSTPEKIMDIPILWIDTGDPELDKKYRGYVKVITGYHDSVVRKVK